MDNPNMDYKLDWSKLKRQQREGMLVIPILCPRCKWECDRKLDAALSGNNWFICPNLNCEYEFQWRHMLTDVEIATLRDRSTAGLTLEFNRLAALDTVPDLEWFEALAAELQRRSRLSSE